ncbi:hypothetical protein [Streptomyces sp. NPDC002104]
MRTRVLPLGEYVVGEALKHYLPKAVRVSLVPPEGALKGQAVYVHRVGGVARNPGQVDNGMYVINLFAPSFREAAELGQAVRTSLYEAERDQFAAKDGRLGKVTEVAAPSPLPHENDGDPFTGYASYTIITR